jgi:SAM-dependent methyltransferase
VTTASSRLDSQATAPAPRIRACPVCRSVDTGFYGTGRDRLFGLAPGDFPLIRCRGCRCIFQEPLPHGSALAGFYPQEYWWDGKAASGGAAARLLRRAEELYRETVVRDHVRFVTRHTRAGNGAPLRLLDIGCGSGSFLAMVKRAGFEACGMDISERAVRAAIDQYGLDVRQGGIGSAVWADTRFDVVSMFHVLEHVADPRSALRYASSLLKPAGRLVIQVPNVDSLQARIFRTRWYGLDVPRHLINFSGEGLRLLLRESGLRIHAVSRFSLRDNPAALASTVVPWLDPIGRKGRGRDRGRPLLRAALELGYFSLFLLALPFALAESACGLGATLWVQAEVVKPDEQKSA